MKNGVRYLVVLTPSIVKITLQFIMYGSKTGYSYPTNIGQVPVLVIFVLKCSLLKNFNLL